MSDRPETADSEDNLIEVVAESTGMSPAEVSDLMMSDDDLDALCDAVLSRFAAPSEIGNRKR